MRKNLSNPPWIEVDDFDMSRNSSNLHYPKLRQIDESNMVGSLLDLPYTGAAWRTYYEQEFVKLAMVIMMDRWLYHEQQSNGSIIHIKYDRLIASF